jgi:uncharacterized protein YjiS (DUF1127 family)
MSIVNLLIAAGRAIADWRRRKRAYGELMALDDRSLADIGIRRSQIRALVEGDNIRDHGLDRGPLAETVNFWPAQGRLAGLSSKSHS